MEAWRQWPLGGRKTFGYEKVYLTPTGLLMEGVYTHGHREPIYYRHRAQTSLSGETVQTGDKGTARARCDTLSGRLYLFFECLRVGGTGFTALAAERTSSFVNTAKRNGCDSRK